jgi:DNA repair protein RecO (recombination protein O)
MLYKTKGVVLGFLKYKESSIITKIYTQQFGLQSYIENGVRSSKGKNKIALFQPNTLLDLVVYHDQKKEIHRIAEIKCFKPYQSIPYEIRKSSVAIFINEVLNKSLKEHAENQPLFQFLVDTLSFLDENHAGIENFHLYFLLHYCFYLGFAPENANEILSQLFDLSIHIPIDASIASLIDTLIRANFGAPLPMSRSERQQILSIILMFYKVHIENFGEIRSLAVLKEVLEN